MRLFLAGGESHFKSLYKMGARNVLFSYYWMRDRHISSIAKRYRLDDREKVHVMIDSGGFTFNVDPDKHTLQELYDYRDAYIAWLRANKEYIDVAVELDVSVMIGEKRLKKWRDKYFKPLEDEGMQIIYVWHDTDGQAGWKEMTAKHKYVGLTQIGEWTDAQINRYLREAKKNKAKVHGFAFTRPDMLGKLDFTTVDSTTWASGMRYGCTYIFDGRKLITYDNSQKHMRHKYRAHFVKRGIDWDLVKLDETNDKEKRRQAYTEITKINILGWVEFGDYLYRKWRIKHKMRRRKRIAARKLALEQTQEELQTPQPPAIISLIDRPNTPVLKCSHCHISEDCDKFDENRETCAYDVVDMPLDTPDDFLNLRKMILRTDFKRLQRNYQFEQQSGGYLDKSLQSVADSIFARAGQLEADMRDPGPGDDEMPSDSQAKSAGGVLAKILSPLIEGAKAINTIEGHYEETKPVALPPAASEIAYSPLKQTEITPHEALRQDKELARKNRNAEY